MNKNKKNIRTHTIIEKIATFDFDKYYTPTVRLMCHLAMWIVFTFFIQINLLFDYKLPFTVTLLFAGRSLLCNMAVFYLFFYLIVPHTLLKNRVVLAILSLPLCLVLWIILNHYYLLVLGENLMSSNPYLKVVNENQRETFAQVISFKSILVNIIVVFYSISSFFFIKIVFDIIRFYSKWFKSERKSVQLELDKLNLERDFLKAQLNPHFLFNTLNNLYGLSLISDHRTPNAIAQLSQMMRYTLYESNAELVPLRKELEFLENYVMLEKMRYKENKNIVFNTKRSLCICIINKWINDCLYLYKD